MSKDVTIVIKGDGSGLTGTVKTGAGEIRQFGVELDKVSDKAKKAGDEGEKAGKKIGSAIGKAVQGDWKNAATDIAMSAGRMALSFGLIGTAALASAVAIGAVPVAMVATYREGREFTRSILSSGNAAGTTVGQMRDLRTEIGEVNNQYGRAREAVNAMVRSGQVSGDALASAARSAVNLAMLTGDSIDSITKKMTANADEPAKLMRKLNDEYNFLTASVYEQIVALEKEGNTRDALKLGYDELEQVSSARVATMIEHAGGLERAWLAVTGAVARAWNVIKSAGRQDGEHQLAIEVQKLNELEQGYSRTWRGDLVRAASPAQVEEQRRIVENLRARVSYTQDAIAAEAEWQQTQNRGIAAQSAIDKALESGRDKTQRYASAVNDLAKEFQALRAANPGDARLQDVVFHPDGSVSGGAYDSAAAGLREKFRDRGAERSAAQAQREAERNEERRIRTMERLNELTLAQESLYARPVQKAMNDYASVTAKINTIEQELVKAKGLNAEAEAKLTTARENASAAHERNLELAKREQLELDRRADVVGSLLADYEREVVAVSMTRREREIHAAVLAAEDAARRNYAKGLRDTIDLTNEEVTAIRRGIGAMYDWAEQMDAWSMVAMNAVGSFADLMADTFSGGIKSSKSFFAELRDIFKRGWRDVMRTMLDQNFVQPIQSAIMRGLQGVMSGGNSGGGNWLQSLTSMFGGNGFAGGGQNIGNMLGSGQGNWLSRIAGMFGGASGQTGVLSAGGQGWGVLSGGTSSLGGAAGGAAGGAGAMASAIPIIGWIYAGMQMNASLYDKGWATGGQETDILRSMTRGTLGGLPMGGLSGAAFGVMSVDRLLQGIGLDGRWASILSGSSLLSRAFGRKAPEISGQGITGTGSLDGFSGNAFADITQRGGWFRSTRRWTETAALDSEIQQAFNAAIGQISRGVDGLVQQLGTDVQQQLSAVRVNIGRIELDADPEVAQRQLETALDKMINDLASGAVRALGFGRLLDQGFAAVEVMSGLSATIALVAGNAQDLGRALNAVEIENVSRAMEWFMDRALANATELSAEIESVVSMLNSYGSLIGDVQTQIRTAGLSQYQRAALDIETQYRQQTRAANELARALGLSGARAEDLASIEQLRAIRMADLQRVMEEERNRTLDDLRLSQYSPLTDREKLTDSMAQLQAAVASGDVQRARQLSESALGFGRNLYASGRDYNAVYDQVTALLQSMGLDNMDLDMEDGTTMGELADILLDLPGGIARELFALLYNPTTSAPPVVAPPVVVPPGVGIGGGGSGGGGGGVEDRLEVLIGIMAKSLAVSEETLHRQVERGVAEAAFR